MSYRSILVHVDDSAGCRSRLMVAARLAQRFDAHLTGLFTTWSPMLEVNMAEFPAHEAIAASKEFLVACERRVRAEFDAVMREVGQDRVEWRERLGQPLQALCTNARYHDLVVLGQFNPAAMPSHLPRDFVPQAVLSVGRPTLVVPYAGQFDTVGRRVMVGWDAGQAATRALTDALPLLKLAERTTVQTFNARRLLSDQGELPGGDIALYLARHGIEVDLQGNLEGIVDVGSQLLSMAATIDADLLVMGAYGHSRVLEILLGGATRTVLDDMTLPVLMSH